MYIMSQHFDTNLGNYQTDDLEQMFNLQKPYTKRDVENNCNALKIKVSTHHDGEDEVLQNLLNFIMAAKNTLEKEMESDFMKLPPADIMENNSHDIIDRRVAHQENVENISTAINARDETNQKSIWSCDNVFQQLSIDTLFRDNYDKTKASDLHISLLNPIKKVVGMELVSLELPSNINLISDKHNNNVFQMTYDNSANTVTTFTVSNGRYTESEMNAELNPSFAALNTAGNDLSGVTVSINNTSGKVTFTNVSSSNRTLNFRPNINVPQNQTLGWILGFRKETYVLVKGTPLVSEGSYDSALLKYFYIMIDDYNRNIVNSTVVPAFNKQPLNNNIMGRIIPRTYGSGSDETTYYECSNIEHNNTKIRKYLGPVDIHKLHIQLLDNHGRVLDLDNMDYSLALALECVYD